MQQLKSMRILERVNKHIESVITTEDNLGALAVKGKGDYYAYQSWFLGSFSFLKKLRQAIIFNN